MTRASNVAIWLKLIIISLTGLMVACGGGGGSSVPTDTTITGSVVAAPVHGASVVVKDTGGNTLAGPVTTGSDGRYSIDIPNSALSGAMVIESTGGSFTDEATGFTGSAGMLAAHVVGNSLTAGSAVHMTPASTIIQELMRNHGKTFAEAQAAFKAAFGFEVDTSIAPVDVTNPPADAEQANMLAGLHAAVFSQLTMDLGLTVGVATEQFDLLPALARDIADGKFDGQDASGIIAITNLIDMPADVHNRFTHALVTMHEGTKEKTGIPNDKIGDIAFVKLATTSSYTVKYIPDSMMMNEKIGKTTFTLRITNNVDNSSITGETITLKPIMHMATMMHASSADGCTEADPVNEAGDYQCTVYYLMASSMNGISMGFWQLNVGIGGSLVPIMMNDMIMGYEMQGGESAVFYPDVMMSMGDTALAKLYGGANDKIMGMAMGGMSAMPEDRTYYLFNDGLTTVGGGSHTFDLFIAARENMMSFPGVSADTTLSANTTDQLVANPMVVEITTTPNVAGSWIAATDNGNGHWSTTGFNDLTDTLHVRLIINTEQKTKSGSADPGGDVTDGYTTFTVTPM